MNRKRLEKLADFLETDPTVNTKGKFHLHYWMGSYDYYLHNVDPATEKAMQKLVKKAGDGACFTDDGKPITCRTAGCAFGWATTIPSFRRAGLSFKVYKEQADVVYTNKKTGESFLDFNAAMEFFDISYLMSCHFFDPAKYEEKDLAKPKLVAKRIRKYLDDNKAYEQKLEKAQGLW